MDMLILAVIVLGGIALEGVIFSRARKRTEYEETVARRLARYAGAGRGREV